MGLTRINNQALTDITSAGLPSGSVVQVKSAVIDNTDQNTSSSSFQASAITLSITPSSASSKILALVSTHAYCDNGTAGAITIYRGSTNLATHGSEYGMTRVYNLYGTWQSVHISHLDSPATTSSTTYTVYWKNVTASNLVYLGQSNNESSITLMEIAG